MKSFKVLYTPRLKRDCKKAKHPIEEELGSTVRLVLVLNPEHGMAIPGFGLLRKMRVAIPGFGKSGGYRLVYMTQEIDETRYFIFLRTYFKSETEDLTRGEYQELIGLGKDILENWLDYTWEDFDPPLLDE